MGRGVPSNLVWSVRIVLKNGADGGHNRNLLDVNRIISLDIPRLSRRQVGFENKWADFEGRG